MLLLADNHEVVAFLKVIASSRGIDIKSEGIKDSAFRDSFPFALRRF
jgi:hypothetical protein